ncbi:heterokaryon incompatibility protein-domain-containing protein [Lasiosphaeria hispida]|uniref:Heterokaryon incompatibility protein-domain-containing protein n=1 Tax=Lasiosphaeria hispida TaxID=260671 RepID=A0AAJ0HPK8_9PEZI|nr:heterokaryon incompatibility protein-domain-containing protein [Lasiosphaeria hispida]
MVYDSEYICGEYYGGWGCAYQLGPPQMMEAVYYLTSLAGVGRSPFDWCPKHMPPDITPGTHAYPQYAQEPSPPPSDPQPPHARPYYSPTSCPSPLGPHPRRRRPAGPRTGPEEIRHNVAAPPSQPVAGTTPPPENHVRKVTITKTGPGFDDYYYGGIEEGHDIRLGLSSAGPQGRSQRRPGVRLPLIVPPEGSEKRKGHRITYTPLPTSTSIRLLRIEPPEKLEDEFDVFRPIRCTLEVKDLADSPVYDALSYTWGCPVTVYDHPGDVCSPAAWASPAFDITCDGKLFSVTTNLYTALLSVRFRATALVRQYSESVARKNKEMKIYSASEVIQHTLSPYIWVDQICINQSDLQERQAQVLLMGRIYRQAQKVPVWVGGEDEFARDGLETIIYLSNIDIKMWGTLLNIHQREITDPETFIRFGLEPIPPHKWIALYALLSRSWFRRSWIAQEVVLGEFITVCCGLIAVDFSAINAAIDVLQGSKWMDQLSMLVKACLWGQDNPYSKQLSQLRAHPQWRNFCQPVRTDRPNLSLPRNIIWLRNSQLFTADPGIATRRPERTKLSCGLAVVLQCFRGTIATNPRDKIYAFLGIAEAIGHPARLQPDYSKPIQGVFVDCMRSLLLTSNSLDALTLKEDLSLTNLAGLPSWVPDLLVEPFPVLQTHLAISPWFASDPLGSRHLAILPEDVLELKGVSLGRISASCKFTWYARAGNNHERDKHYLLRVLQELPAYSQIRIPTITPPLRDYLEEFNLGPEQKTLNTPFVRNEGAVVRQSRLEVLWRTLVSDCFGDEYPSASSNTAVFRRFWHVAFRSVVAGVMMAKPHDAFGLPKPTTRQSPASRDEELDRAWESICAAISRMYAAQLLADGATEEVEEGVLPPAFEAARPDLKAAWKEGRAWSSEEMIEFIGSGLGDPSVYLGADTADGLAESQLTTRISYNITGRLLFATEKGRLGQGPKSLREGDEAWILAGGRTPYILRPRQDGRYDLLGEAYVHGAMHGAAVEGVSDADLRTVLLV